MRAKYRIRQIDAGITPDELAERVASVIEYLTVEVTKHEQHKEELGERDNKAREIAAAAQEIMDRRRNSEE